MIFVYSSNFRNKFSIRIFLVGLKACLIKKYGFGYRKEYIYGELILKYVLDILIDLKKVPHLRRTVIVNKLYLPRSDILST